MQSVTNIFERFIEFLCVIQSASVAMVIHGESLGSKDEGCSGILKSAGMWLSWLSK